MSGHAQKAVLIQWLRHQLSPTPAFQLERELSTRTSRELSHRKLLSFKLNGGLNSSHFSFRISFLNAINTGTCIMRD